ncbi:MAG TPA: ATP-binding protein, partial [Pseudomonadota bacterium]|nr:ATP-binding protein [Pseudomonadota bacterium]
PGIRIVTEVSPDAESLQTDPGLLRQILINLLTNAIDATSAHQADAGSVATVTGRIFVSAKTEGSEVVLAVRDEGTGIAPDDLQRIFEPFYTTKGRGRGTGLGLSICRELTRSLGGKITVESAPGQGSTFALRLPRVPQIKQAA